MEIIIENCEEKEDYFCLIWYVRFCTVKNEKWEDNKTCNVPAILRFGESFVSL